MGAGAARGSEGLRFDLVALVRVPNTLRPLTDGLGEIAAGGADLAAVLAAVDMAHPGFGERVLDEHGRLYGFVNVFIGDHECRTLDGLGTAVGNDTVVSIVPAVAGG